MVKVDSESLEVIRDSSGFCQQVKPGDFGMLVGVIGTQNPFSEYIGYSSTTESKKKIIRNIAHYGDYGFVTGDLFEMDYYGNLYFKDRTGDTFRWKGENVSTTEIETIASQYLKFKDCVVYGVVVPNCDGRAGMLATNDRQIDLDSFYNYLKLHLPDYAVPKFIRITERLQSTSTFKFIKYSLRNEGFDINAIQTDELLYYFNRKEKCYSLLTQKSFEDIKNGLITF